MFFNTDKILIYPRWVFLKSMVEGKFPRFFEWVQLRGDNPVTRGDTGEPLHKTYFQNKLMFFFRWYVTDP